MSHKHINQLFILPLFIFLGTVQSEAVWAKEIMSPAPDAELRAFLDQVYKTMDEHYYLPVSRQKYDLFLEQFPASKLMALNSKTKKTPDFIHLGAGLLVNQLKSPDDAFTNFVPPEKSREFKEKAYAITFDLGIEGKKIESGFEITKVQKHSEAAQKGIKPRDVLIQIDSFKLDRLDETAIQKLLTPESGQKVKLLLRRYPDNTVTEVLLESKTYFKETVERLRDPAPDTIAIRISHFNQMTGKDFEEELVKIKTPRSSRLILDLRGNEGGPPLGAREILGYFLKPNDFLFAISRKKQKPVMLTSPAKKELFEGSLYILVNSKTGSAAEMMSGVLQRKGVAKLVGEKTAGATYLKSIYDFEDKSMIFMITSLTFFYDRAVFPKNGLTPDILLDANTDSLQYVATKL